MARTTVDIDAPILKDLKRLQKQEGKPLGRLISDLLAEALARHRAARSQPAPFRWVSRPMRARIDVSDKDALYLALEDKAGKRSR
ncbi:MAG TPA: antitoxin [Methylomirabilota bacterium]|nr:antitoxin [Methylomirabilota bacterium]